MYWQLTLFFAFIVTWYIWHDKMRLYRIKIVYVFMAIKILPYSINFAIAIQYCWLAWLGLVGLDWIGLDWIGELFYRDVSKMFPTMSYQYRKNNILTNTLKNKIDFFFYYTYQNSHCYQFVFLSSKWITLIICKAKWIISINCFNITLLYLHTLSYFSNKYYCSTFKNIIWNVFL